MFPFGDFDHKEAKEFTSRVSELSRVRDAIYPERQPAKTMEAASFVFRCLKEECEFEGTLFVDCMGKKAETCLYAAIFGIEESVSIESYKPFGEEGEALVEEFCPVGKVIRVVTGTFYDYFRFDATIIYLDCTELVDSSDYMDEGVFLLTYFEMCSKCLPGTHCVVVTYNSHLNPKVDYNASNLRVAYKSSVCTHTEEECYVYVCVVLSDMSKVNILQKLLSHH